MFGEGSVKGGLGIETHLIKNLGNVKASPALFGKVFLGFRHPVTVDKIKKILIELIIYQLGHLPGVETTVEIEGLSFQVLAATRRRIIKTKITRNA